MGFYSLLFWPVFCCLMAFMQGRLMPAVRLTKPGTEARKQSFALHWVGGAAYFLPLCFVPTWAAVTVAISFRVLIFDLVLNYAAGDPLFHVGKTASTDRLLNWVAVRVGLPVTYLSALIRIIALLLLAVLIFKTSGGVIHKKSGNY